MLWFFIPDVSTTELGDLSSIRVNFLGCSVAKFIHPPELFFAALVC